MTIHTTTTPSLIHPHHLHGKEGAIGTSMKRRLPHHGPPPRVALASLHCCVEATSLRHHACFVWLPPRLIYHVRVHDTESNATWLTQCTPRDIHRLHQHLVRRAVDPDTVHALHILRCPDVPLMQPRDGLEIKAMCVDTEHFLHNLLAMCQQTASSSPDAAFVSFFVAAFLKANRKHSTHDVPTAIVSR